MSMPAQTQTAVDWALSQTELRYSDVYPGIAPEDDGELRVVEPSGRIDRHLLVDVVRYYFTAHNIECRPMSAADLDPYLPPSE